MARDLASAPVRAIARRSARRGVVDAPRLGDGADCPWNQSVAFVGTSVTAAPNRSAGGTGCSPLPPASRPCTHTSNATVWGGVPILCSCASTAKNGTSAADCCESSRPSARAAGKSSYRRAIQPSGRWYEAPTHEWPRAGLPTGHLNLPAWDSKARTYPLQASPRVHDRCAPPPRPFFPLPPGPAGSDVCAAALRAARRAISPAAAVCPGAFQARRHGGSVPPGWHPCISGRKNAIPAILAWRLPDDTPG